MAEEAWVLDHDARGLVVDRRGKVLDALGVGRQCDDGAGGEAAVGGGRRAVVGMQPARQDGLVAPGDTSGHRHRLGAGGGAVVHRGVRHLHGGDQRDLGLELEQGLQRALGNLGLVRRVRG